MESDLPLYWLILKVGHEPMPPTVGTNVLGRKVLYLPSFFTYGECASWAGTPTPTQKSIKWGAGPAGPGEHMGSMAPRVRAGVEEGIPECGRRQQGIGVRPGE